MNLTIEQRAREIADFLKLDYGYCLDRLKQGFGPLHNAVSDDWRRANPQTDEEILEWYRKTTTYIFELSAYHLEPFFNYAGMCQGISQGLRAKGSNRVLCLGDGVGDLSFQLMIDGFLTHYNDLEASQTANFAISRFEAAGAPWVNATTEGWDPDIAKNEYDAIVSLDFLEHVKRPDDWLRAIFAALKPGGWFFGQHAFGIGSGPDGSIPMHLAENDKYEQEYGPLMIEIGFVQEGTSNWWRRPE